MYSNIGKGKSKALFVSSCNKLVAYNNHFAISAIISLIMYFMYLSVSYTLKEKETKVELLMSQTIINQSKALHNDLSIKRDNINNDINSLKDEIKTLNEHIGNEPFMITIMQNDIIKSQNTLHLLQSKLNQIQSDIDSYNYFFDVRKEIISLRQSMRETISHISLFDSHSHQSSGINSKIITSLHEVNLLKQWLGIKGDCDFKLIYRFSEELNLTPHGFHNKCDKYPHTIILIKLNDGAIIGGYASETWKGNGYKLDPYSILFDLTYEKNYEMRGDRQTAIFASEDFFPGFGRDLSIYTTSIVCNFPQTYGTPNCLFELTNGNAINWFIDLELFHIKF